MASLSWFMSLLISLIWAWKISLDFTKLLINLELGSLIQLKGFDNMFNICLIMYLYWINSILSLSLSSTLAWIMSRAELSQTKLKFLDLLTSLSSNNICKFGSSSNRAWTFDNLVYNPRSSYFKRNCRKCR